MSRDKNIQLTDAHTIHDVIGSLKSDESLVVDLIIPRRDIETLNVGRTVDRLMALSDSAAHCRRLSDCVVLTFDGYQFDSRPLWEILPVVRHVHSVARQWNYWLHFTSLDSDSLTLLLRLLTAAYRAGEESVHLAPTPSIPPADRLRSTLTHLLLGLKLLHEQYSIAAKETESRADAVMKYVRRTMSG